MPKTKTRSALVREALRGVADTISFRDGVVTARRSFFFTHGDTASKFAEDVMAILKARGIHALLVNKGEQYVAFRGSHSVAQGSHWWAQFKLVDEQKEVA